MTIAETLKTVFISIVITLIFFICIPLTQSLFHTPPKIKNIRLREISPIILTKNLESKKKTIDEKKEIYKVKISNIPEKRKRFKPMSINMNLQLNYTLTPEELSFRFGVIPDLNIGDIIFELKEVDVPPQPIVRVQPIYPINARIRGIEGEVVLVFTVTSEGNVEDIEVKRSYPGNIFTKSAINAVKQWKFKPGIKDGKPVSVRVMQSIRFRLQQGE